jgi:phage I-like protein
MKTLAPVAAATAADGRFELPQDGYVQAMPYGEFGIPVTSPAAGGKSGSRRLVQVCDRQAAEAMLANFRAAPRAGGLLVDYDHGSLDTDRSSEAAAWVQDLAVRDDGLYVRNRWSDRGLEMVTGGRFMFLSPVFEAGTVQDLGGGRVRPTVLLRLALTNDPNLTGIRPLANRRGAEDTTDSGHDAAEGKEQAMKEALTKLLGLTPDAADEAVLAGVEALANRAQDRDALATQVAGLEQAALEAQVERDLDDHAGVIQDRAAARLTLLANRAEGLKLLRALKPAAKPAEKPAGGELPNRRNGTVPVADPGQAAKDDQRAAGIRNRAAEIQRAQAVSYARAWELAEAECR